MRLLEKRVVSLRVNEVSKLPMLGRFIWRVLAVLVIVAMLANWTWILFAPRSAAVLPAVPPAANSHAERLFGIAAVSAVTVSDVMPNVRLVGVFAGVPGFAVLEIDGKRQVWLAAGREIVAGAKLLEVAADHVVIERNGARQQIPLAGKASTIKSAAAAPVRAIPLPGTAVVPVMASATANAAVPPNVELATQVQQRMQRGRGGL